MHPTPELTYRLKLQYGLGATEITELQELRRLLQRYSTFLVAETGAGVAWLLDGLDVSLGAKPAGEKFAVPRE